ncbi:hypothetical protein Corgl_0115 [Coriobacterium glomerans PW2]|uniref:Kinase n=1 Tax=Coriobacterium glomerans (strain ATCC 49209 / DSM 20642 / JCM 10262 / PW2) TaxID=700015 RepID=F2N9Y7_CORGP|nr:AAA family ATPase [Coriobacterium glomerans]AEB06242.1 hypothetical protein Corgl_0115 [Coriobacterium glomerans PW2]
MSSALILLAGYPATGKSYLLSKLVERHPHTFSAIAPDDIKEEVWDACGFDGAEQKAALEFRVWQLYFSRLDELLSHEGKVISDYPFSDKQKGRLVKTCARHGCRVLTVRLVGDPHVIYARSRKRDLSGSRHLGHLVTRYHAGDVLSDRTQADDLVDLETFLDRCASKGYDRFKLGRLIEIDATYVDRIDYPALLCDIDSFLEGI